MARVLITYYSGSGNTEKMAELIEKAVQEEGVEVSLKDIKSTTVADLLGAEGIIIGSPTYYGGMAWQVKQLLDKSVKVHGKLDGKVGAAFTSSANIGGGNETTILNILNAMLIHGMIVQGDPEGDHYGPVSIDAPDARSKNLCHELGRRVASLVKKLAC